MDLADVGLPENISETAFADLLTGLCAHGTWCEIPTPLTISMIGKVFRLDGIGAHNLVPEVGSAHINP